jgi:hypothetical protein
VGFCPAQALEHQTESRLLKSPITRPWQHWSDTGRVVNASAFGSSGSAWCYSGRIYRNFQNEFCAVQMPLHAKLSVCLLN